MIDFRNVTKNEAYIAASVVVGAGALIAAVRFVRARNRDACAANHPANRPVQLTLLTDDNVATLDVDDLGDDDIFMVNEKEETPKPPEVIHLVDAPDEPPPSTSKFIVDEAAFHRARQNHPSVPKGLFPINVDEFYDTPNFSEIETLFFNPHDDTVTDSSDMYVDVELSGFIRDAVHDIVGVGTLTIGDEYHLKDAEGTIYHIIVDDPNTVDDQHATFEKMPSPSRFLEE